MYHFYRSSLLILCLTNLTNISEAKFAPRQKVVEGTPKLACLGIKYQDTARHATDAQCKNIANSVADFYRQNSRGLLHMNPSGFQVDVPFNGAAKNLNAAENFGMGKHPGFDYYAIVGLFESVSHAGGKVAHLQGTLTRDAEHETGHLLGLGHAGAYKLEGGKMVLDPYGDGDSVMGSFPSATLTAPQYYHQGWLYEDEAVIWEQPGQVYELRRINNFATDKLAAVIVPASVMHPGATGGRDAFISFPPGCDKCAVLHLATGGGSQRVKQFGGEYTDKDFTGLTVKIVQGNGQMIQIAISLAAASSAVK